MVHLMVFKIGTMIELEAKDKVKKEQSNFFCYRCDKLGDFTSSSERIQKLQEANNIAIKEVEAHVFLIENVFLQ